MNCRYPTLSESVKELFYNNRESNDYKYIHRVGIYMERGSYS